MRTPVLLGILLLSAALPSCRAPAPGGAGGNDAASSGDGPHRVAVLAPAAAEMLVALDLSDRIVAIGDFGPWPDSLHGLPSLGGYDAPNLERAVDLQVDLLVTTASDAASASHRRLEALGIPVLALDTSTERGVFAALDRIGATFDRAAEASELAASMRAALEAISSRARGAPARRVLVVVGRDPLYVAGPGSHIDEMIRRVGGVNVAHDALAPYQQVSLEAVLERMPEVIIDTADNHPDAPRGRIPGEWARWEFLPAVRDGRVFLVAPDHLVIPGLRLPEMTRLTGKLVQPEIFGEPTPEELR